MMDIGLTCRVPCIMHTSLSVRWAVCFMLNEGNLCSLADFDGPISARMSLCCHLVEAHHSAIKSLSVLLHVLLRPVYLTYWSIQYICVVGLARNCPELMSTICCPRAHFTTIIWNFKRLYIQFTKYTHIIYRIVLPSICRGLLMEV